MDSLDRDFLDQFIKRIDITANAMHKNGHSKGLNNRLFMCKNECIYKDVLVTKELRLYYQKNKTVQYSVSIQPVVFKNWHQIIIHFVQTQQILHLLKIQFL